MSGCQASRYWRASRRRTRARPSGGFVDSKIRTLPRIQGRLFLLLALEFASLITVTALHIRNEHLRSKSQKPLSHIGHIRWSLKVLLEQRLWMNGTTKASTLIPCLVQDESYKRADSRWGFRLPVQPLVLVIEVELYVFYRPTGRQDTVLTSYSLWLAHRSPGESPETDQEHSPRRFLEIHKVIGRV
ncbi:hypothetical protein RRG08_052337 [Elysia crispata]|uniref:Uncharacterized protein n=1 Tax=Elysia crispata TaxID=231223 RepID=A0AAE0Z9V6_9GAST|nr:hypothetical protein RRG08_052337 [Elysia crispata]